MARYRALLKDRSLREVSLSKVDYEWFFNQFQPFFLASMLYFFVFVVATTVREAVATPFEFVVPDPPPSPLFLSRGWTTGTPITRPGAYSWTGPFDHPATFTISGVPFDGDVGIPMTAVLNATGVLEPNGGTVSAAEPNGLLVAMAALVGLGAWRRSARQR